MEIFLQKQSLILTSDQRVRVFISSTLDELKSERREVKKAVLELTLYPIMFESGARPYPPKAVYRKSVEQSDIFIAIYWQSYGWVAPDMKISGIEDEYETSKRKPRLVYIKEPSLVRDPRLTQLIERVRSEGDICYHSFSNKKELAELVKQDIIQILSERFQQGSNISAGKLPDYTESLKDEIATKHIVKRDKLTDEVKESLVSQKALLLLGDPGIGKTYILAQLADQLNGIYISLRNKTTQQVCSYIAGHLSVRRGQIPRLFPTETDARAALQEELANNSAVLLIDEIDQNVTSAQAILGLDFFSCRVLYASRSVPASVFKDVGIINIPNFNRDEVNLFLELYNIQPAPGEFETIYSSSNGNPLYLFYFTKFRITPPPQGLEKYQYALWQTLSPVQKEISNIIAHSFAPLRVDDIHGLINADHLVSSTPMQTRQLLELAFPLIREVGGYFEIFHPFFEEYIVTQASTDHLSKHYHRILGEYAMKKKGRISTAYHLLRAGDSRVKYYLIDGAAAAAFRGDWLIAEELLEKEIELVALESDKRKEGQARYLLSQIYQEMGKYPESRIQVDNAVRLFIEIGENELSQDAKIWSSVIDIEGGDTTKSIDELQCFLQLYQGKDLLREAGLHLNLSFAYLRSSRIHEGMAAAKKALELFSKIKDERGVAASLTNLAAFAGELEDYKTQKKYALEIIQRAERRHLPRLKAAGLNHIAIVQRNEGNPVGAQRSLQECIAICQSLGAIEAETLNIANLGNAFRDQKLFDKAEKAYSEALVKAKEFKLQREEAFALELLARIRIDKRDYNGSINYGLKALELHRQLMEKKRIASTCADLAKSYSKIDKPEESAKYFEEAAANFEAVEIWNSASYYFDTAAGIWYSINKVENANNCLRQGLKSALLGADYKKVTDILEKYSSITTIDLDLVYKETFIILVKQSATSSLASVMRSFSIYVKKDPTPERVGLFKYIIDLLLNAIEKSHSHHLINALAVGIEQANEQLLSTIELDLFDNKLSGTINHLYYRSLPDNTKIWTFGFEWECPIVVQLICLVDDYLGRKMSLVLSLILKANELLIHETITQLGGNKESAFILNIVTETEFRKNIDPTFRPPKRHQDITSDISESNVPWGQKQPPTLLILHDDYESVSDWASNPDNRAFVWLLMNIYRALVVCCTHQNRKDTKQLARKAREFCEAILL